MKERVLLWLFVAFQIAGVPADSQTSRPFSMSSSGAQALPGQVPMYQNMSPSFSLQNLSADADILSLFPEYLGVPFDAFATSATLAPGDPWSVQMTALASAAKATGKPLMIQTVLTRDIFAAKAVSQSGKLVIQTGWIKSCADLTSSQYSGLGDAYVNYATWMARTFSPKYMVIMVEMNLYYAHCGGNTASWQALTAIENRAYAAVKNVNSAIIAFPSFRLEDLYDQSLNGFDQAQYAALASLKRDRLGLATYPYALPAGSGFVNPYQLPLDYLARVRNLNPTEPRIVITETGWNSAGLSVLYQGNCFANFVYSDTSWQAAYLQLLLYSAYVDNFEHISWWSDRDLIPTNVMNGCSPLSSPPYPECNGGAWCQAINVWRATDNGWTPGFAEVAFKSFGTLGLRQYDGTSKPSSLALWQRFLALPISSGN